MNKVIVKYLFILIIILNGCENNGSREKIYGKSLKEVVNHYYDEEVKILQIIEEHNLFIYQFPSGSYVIQKYEETNQGVTFDGSNNSYSITGINEPFNHSNFIKISRFYENKLGYFIFGYVSNPQFNFVNIKYNTESNVVVEEKVEIINQSFFLYVKNKMPTSIIEVTPILCNVQ